MRRRGFGALKAVRGFGSLARGFEWRRGFGVLEASWIRSGGVRGLGRGQRGGVRGDS